MIIDYILDRKDEEEDMRQGYTHKKMPNGDLIPLAYDPMRFYRNIIGYGEIAWPILSAMDYGTEQDVKNELCSYVMTQNYNPAICDYINSRNWLTA